MLPFEVTILGSSSATPTSKRFPSAQVLNVQGRFFLIDCGEAAQIQLRKYGVRIQKIEHIFISHLHGDHIYGLPGLLGTMHLLGRNKELHVHSPEGLQKIIEVIHEYSDTHLRFPLHFHVTDPNKSAILFEDEKITVSAFPLSHRIPCTGFLFREKPALRNVIKEKLQQYHVPFAYINKIRAGEDFRTDEGTVVSNTELTMPPSPVRTYAYCSDTSYSESLIEHIHGVDLLYHEATFSKDLSERAKETCHSTAEDAATIAKKAEVKRLLIGHFSARYNDLQPLLDEARAVFPDTLLAEEGLMVSI